MTFCPFLPTLDTVPGMPYPPLMWKPCEAVVILVNFDSRPCRKQGKHFVKDKWYCAVHEKWVRWGVDMTDPKRFPNRGRQKE